MSQGPYYEYKDLFESLGLYLLCNYKLNWLKYDILPGCDKSYGKKHHLREHERKHSGDMKFACEVCGKKFYMHAHMKRHMYSHTGHLFLLCHAKISDSM